eukprot:m.282134 g.282134  ORF g.282134 m.282134 type:complete len:69 (+) comp141034_c0_seq1:111-317(+)
MRMQQQRQQNTAQGGKNLPTSFQIQEDTTLFSTNSFSAVLSHDDLVPLIFTRPRIISLENKYDFLQFV